MRASAGRESAILRNQWPWRVGGRGVWAAAIRMGRETVSDKQPRGSGERG